MPPTQSTPAHGRKHISPERLLVGELIILFHLLDEVRHRALARAFGVSREDSTVVTLIAIGAVFRAVRRVLASPRTQIRKARSSPTFAGDTLIGTAVFKETIDSIAGQPTRDTPFAAALITFAVLAHLFRPAGALRALRESVRAVIADALRLRAEFTARATSGRYDG